MLQGGKKKNVVECSSFLTADKTLSISPESDVNIRVNMSRSDDKKLNVSDAPGGVDPHTHTHTAAAV